MYKYMNWEAFNSTALRLHHSYFHELSEILAL